MNPLRPAPAMNDNPSLPEEEPADIDDGSETADAT
jgi:hypothetical protein